MNALVFLLLAVAVSAVGTLVLWLISRPSRSPDSSIEEFNATLRALSGDRPGGRPGGRNRGG